MRDWREIAREHAEANPSGPVPALGAGLDKWVEWAANEHQGVDCEPCQAKKAELTWDERQRWTSYGVVFTHAEAAYNLAESTRLSAEWRARRRTDALKRLDSYVNEEAWRRIARERVAERAAELRAEYFDDVDEFDSRAEHGGDFILDQPETIPALWGKDDQVLWAEGEGFMLNGHQGVGKTTLAQQLVLAMVGVRPPELLGLPVRVTERRILYLAMDRPRQAARSFRRMVRDDDRERLNEHLTIWRGPLPVSPCAGSAALADWVREACSDCGTVVVDSVKDLTPGISSDEVGAALNMAWQELIARDVQLLLLHHERKAGSDSKRNHTLDDVYGSTWLTSGLGSVVAIAGDPGDPTIELRHLKQPAEPVGPLAARHEHNSGTTTLFHGETDLLDLLISAGEEGLTARGAALQIIGRAQDGDVKKMQRRLNEMVAELQAEKRPGSHSQGGRTKDVYVASPQLAWWRSNGDPHGTSASDSHRTPALDI